MSVTDDTAPRQSFASSTARVLLGALAVAIFFAAWQAVFLVAPFNPLFISKPNLIGEALVQLLAGGDLLRDLAISAVPFFYGFVAAVVVGRTARRGHRLAQPGALDARSDHDDLYASPLVALAPLVIVFFGVGVSGKALIIFMLSVFPFIFNAQAGVRAIDPLLINVVRSMGGTERDLYLKVLIPGVLPYIVAGARIAVGRGLIGILVGEFFAASEGIGLRDRPLRRSVRARQDVCLHLCDHGDRRCHDRGHPLGGARCVSMAGRAMTDARTLQADIAPAGELGAPGKGLWQRLEPSLYGFAGVAVLLVAWEVLPRVITLNAGTKLFFTTPSQIVGTLWNLFATGVIWTPLGVSASGFALGLGLAVVVGLPLGVLIGRSRTLNAMLDPFVTAFNATPRLVFLPLVMLWFGLGPVDQGRHRIYRRAVSDPDQHLRRRPATRTKP